MPLTKLKSSFQKTTFSKYANSFQAVSKPGLERIQRLCDLIGNPEKACKFIHVAGTNGKGSVCAYMTEILMEKGYKVGKYISPNLIKVNERISINNVDISNKDLKKTLKYLEPFADQVKNETGIAPTQFEIWTAAAFLYFQKNSCDYVVLEVGLGGELDATNVIPKNEIAIITRLGMDHMNYLGNTLSDIAKAKAGIIKKDCSTKKVITVNQDDEVLKVIQNTATENGSECIVTSPISVSYSDIYETFSFHSEVFTCGIPGLHQIENAALAVEAALVLGIDIPSIKNGISKAKNPARFELLEKGNNTILYDGGHNFNGITALVASLNRYYPNREKAVIFACMRDKEINDSLQLLHDEKTTFYFTTVKNNPRAMSEIELKEHAQEIGIEGMAFRNVNNAIRYAKKRHSLILICGSLYLYEKIKRR